MVSPTSGSGLGTARVAVNTAGLAAGTLNATITVAATGATPKSVPVTLTVTAPSTGAATVSWNASTSSDVVGYKVYKATASGSYGAPIATLQGSVLSYQAIGLQMNTTYFFVVTSYDAAGNESLYSNEVSKSIF
jgi:fibronectin type 3 domain-containing protein